MVRHACMNSDWIPKNPIKLNKLCLSGYQLEHKCIAVTKVLRRVLIKHNRWVMWCDVTHVSKVINVFSTYVTSITSVSNKYFSLYFTWYNSKIFTSYLKFNGIQFCWNHNYITLIIKKCSRFQHNYIIFMYSYIINSEGRLSHIELLPPNWI